MLFLVVPVIYAGSIWTGSLSPSSANLCGSYAKNVTLQATNVWNSESVTLTGVNATLITNSSGLTFLTNQTVNLGNIDASSQSSIEPNWTIQCNESFPGNYTLYVNYSSSNGYNGSSLDQSITSIITVFSSNDATAPTVTSHTPTGKITTSSTILNVTTNENATCKYSTASGVNYDNMDGTFDTTGGTTHKKTLTGLTDNTYHFYVRCKDAAGNKATTDYDASFEVDIAPTAQISLSDPSPVKVGTITVTLTTSEDVKPNPILKYSLSGSSLINIPLSGSGSSWTGYIIIESSDNNKIGSFEFSGFDLTGNTGTVITSGNLFLVDTVTPSVPALLTATSKANGNIKLSWYYDGEDVDHYNIYKSTTEGVDKLDFYKSKTTKSYIDTSTKDQTTYYYRVSAVDDAGNEGPLSDEVSVKSVKTTTTTTQSSTAETATLSPELIKKVDNSTKIIDDLIIEIDEILSDFGNNDPEDIQHLEIIEQINSGKNRLNNLKKELEELKLQDLSEIALELKLKRINVKINVIKKSIPKSLEVIEKKDFKLEIDSDDIQIMLNELLEVLRMTNLEDDKIQDYIKKSQEFQDRIDINTIAKIIEIIYMDDTEKEVTLIHKKIFIKDSGILEDIVLMESIPKTIANDVSEIEFKNSGYSIVEKDPIVKWSFDKLKQNQELIYIINKKVNLENIEETKSVILINPKIELREVSSDSKVTGLAIFSGSILRSTSIYIIIGVIIITGLLVYYFVIMERREPKKQIMSIGLLNKAGSYMNKIFNRDSKKQLITNYPAVSDTYHFNYADKEYTASGLTNLKDINLHILLDKAHNHIDKMNFDLANKIYLLVTSYYKSLESISEKEKQRIQNQIINLYHKLVLYAKLNEAHICTNMGNNLNLRYVLNHIAEFYNKLAKDNSGEETKLMGYAKEVHGQYARSLINSNKK
ncbi:fibronectin type III domain-containing protein [archaeon AH-315-M20]|nr:fibronectin type III domain-containing protein [archaeon AH-315-M20]